MIIAPSTSQFHHHPSPPSNSFAKFDANSGQAEEKEEGGGGQSTSDRVGQVVGRQTGSRRSAGRGPAAPATTVKGALWPILATILLLSTAALPTALCQPQNDTEREGMDIKTDGATLQLLLNSSTSSPFFPSSPSPSTLPADLINSSSSFSTSNWTDSIGSISVTNITTAAIVPAASSNNGTAEGAAANLSQLAEATRHFQLISLNWTHVQAPFSLALWLLLASVAKIFFNLDRRVPEAVPDSALLIILGLVLGTVLRLLEVDAHFFTLPSSTFFLYLLPPIIFDAGYFMPNRQLFDNLDSVLLFAFCGTIWNTLAIGFSLLWLAHLCLFSVPFTAFQILLFASLISAVDPVAVIAVFEEIHINEFLFINVFGEALFNDGVSVVLYQMFRKFILIGEHNLLPLDFIAGIGSFLVIALGGILIGLLFAVIASLATKFTTRMRILAPVFIFVIPYMSYLTAEMFGLSSILAIVSCGIGMKQYVKGNLSHDASSSVKYFVKMLAQSSETVIFMFLGLSTVSREHHCWDWAFVGATVGLCLLHRVIGVVVQCAILNRFRTKKFSFSDQFVLSYGGLRGAIAFGLVISLDDGLPAKPLFVTTCIAVIFFTVFIQGITIRPLLSWLKVEKQDLDHEGTMIEKIYTRYCDYMMAGLEDIAGQKGKNSIRDGFERFNAKVMKPALMRGEMRKTFDTSSIVRAYKKITLLEAHRLARSSIRKRPNGRVAPAHSPSSVSSINTYSNCWTTTTTVNGHITNGGGSGAHSPLSANGNGPVRLRRPTSGEETGERPSSAHSTQHSGEERGGVNRVELEQYLAQPENAEVLYAMFSRLLDRKMAEMRLPRKEKIMDEVEEEEEEEEEMKEDDIHDNYLDALGAGRKKRVMMNGAGANFLSPPQLRKKSGDERRRLSLSPAIERQMGSPSPIGLVSPEYMQGVIAARRMFLSDTSPPSRDDIERNIGVKRQLRRDIP